MKLTRRDVLVSSSAIIMSGGCVRSATFSASQALQVPDDFFGLHINNAAQAAIPKRPETPFPQIGERAIRLWDSGTAWRNLNPTPSLFDFSGLDYRISEAKANGCQIMLTLGQSPDWASKPNPGSHSYNPNPPYRIDDWSKYVDAVSRHCKDQIDYYEIWNEVNLLSGFGGSLQNLLELQEVAVRILRINSPSVRILSPNFAPPYRQPDHSPVSLEEWLKAGGARMCDAISFHAYAGDGNQPEDTITRISEARATLARYGADHLPIYDTESGPRGWRDAGGRLHNMPETGFGEPLPSVPIDLQSAWLTRHMLSVASTGLRQSYFYNFDNPDGKGGTRSVMAINMTEFPDNPGVLLRPALAYRYLASLLAGARITTLRDGDKMQINFVARDGRIGYAAWSTGAPVAQHLNSGQYVTDNAAKPIPGGRSVRLTESPLFIFNE